jgi:hypothetical protein
MWRPPFYFTILSLTIKSVPFKKYFVNKVTFPEFVEEFIIYSISPSTASSVKTSEMCFKPENSMEL